MFFTVSPVLPRQSWNILEHARAVRRSPGGRRGNVAESLDLAATQGGTRYLSSYSCYLSLEKASLDHKSTHRKGGLKYPAAAEATAKSDLS